MKYLKSAFCLLLCSVSIAAFSQLSKGMLKMEVNGIKMNGEDAPPEMSSMLGSMDISIFSDGVIQKSVLNMMMMKTISIMDTKSDSTHIYMDMMGKKYRISESRKSKSDYLNDRLPVKQDNSEVKEFPEDTKEILGFKCERVEVKMKLADPKSKNEEGQDLTLKMYVTKDLRFDPSYVTQTGKKLAINGTPLEYNMTMGAGTFQMEITMLAKEFKRDVDPKDLLAPTGNFKEYTMEQFQAEMSKMAGKN